MTHRMPRVGALSTVAALVAVPAFAAPVAGSCYADRLGVGPGSEE